MTMPEPASTPYADLAAGYVSGRGSGSPGLDQISAAWNSQVAAGVALPARSVLAQATPSPVASNASAPSAQTRLMPSGDLLPSANGSSAGSYTDDNQLRLRGVLPLK